MTYLIDGHNLIPKLPGLSLDQLDDEQALIEILVGFSVSCGRQVEVFFDQGQLNSQHDFQRGRVHVHFARRPLNADQAIQARLLGIGKAARNYTVVTDDHEVQNRARRLGASILGSESFARQLQDSRKKPKKNARDPGPVTVGKDEIEEWLEIFSKGKNKSGDI